MVFVRQDGLAPAVISTDLDNSLNPTETSSAVTVPVQLTLLHVGPLAIVADGGQEKGQEQRGGRHGNRILRYPGRSNQGSTRLGRHMLILPSPIKFNRIIER